MYTAHSRRRRLTSRRDVIISLSIIQFVTRHTLVWKCILVAAFSLSDISATVASIGVTFCMTVHIGSGQIFSPFGGSTPRNPQIRHFGPKFCPFDREYLENGKSQRKRRKA